MNLIPRNAGVKAVRASLIFLADTQLAESTIHAAMARIDRGVYDHLNRPKPPPDQTTHDAMLDIINDLYRTLVETRGRLENGLTELDKRRGQT